MKLILSEDVDILGTYMMLLIEACLERHRRENLKGLSEDIT